ncbi:Acyl-protein synthetase, LuxE [Salinimicrobium catena]|uniref:Acyl-protein synthetase, LuxE n=1 Tax=Salinimicrobium catena TaxID=390640 RepID=A0A1H5JL60_9FLAO|nr:acyl transferase [Salinimicrobium catena]SDK88593.1 Acyl-protein synthetase, LuxE [Salinimicrobium catena]SEE53222.1 Acyl-protein synthetase, LuxE [Salinimicrobium catena]
MHNKFDIFDISAPEAFDARALEVFEFQYTNNKVYRQFCDLLSRTPEEVKHVKDIPFLPIEFFKTHKILSWGPSSEKIFTSSGTTGQNTSKHYVTDLQVYVESFRRGFEHFYGSVEDYAVLALLPSYLEREGSSLIYMVDDLIKKSENPHSGFYLHDLDALKEKIELLEHQEQKILLIGVSFALLDLVEKFRFNLKHTVIMETGGMKGRRKEMIRKELHQVLKAGFGVEKIHSEYGMTELLSQAYSTGDGIFECPPWMKIIIRDPEDALSLLPEGKSGGINVIDLANINSCSFIATQDLGKDLGAGKIEILGRFDNSDIRGCNLMVF